MSESRNESQGHSDDSSSVSHVKLQIRGRKSKKSSRPTILDEPLLLETITALVAVLVIVAIVLAGMQGKETFSKTSFSTDISCGKAVETLGPL